MFSPYKFFPLLVTAIKKLLVLRKDSVSLVGLTSYCRTGPTVPILNFSFFVLNLLQGANTVPVNPLVRKAHYSKRCNSLLSLHIKALKVNLHLNFKNLFFAALVLIGLVAVPRHNVQRVKIVFSIYVNCNYCALPQSKQDDQPGSETINIFPDCNRTINDCNSRWWSCCSREKFL